MILLYLILNEIKSSFHRGPGFGPAGLLASVNFSCPARSGAASPEKYSDPVPGGVAAPANHSDLDPRTQAFHLSSSVIFVFKITFICLLHTALISHVPKKTLERNFVTKRTDIIFLKSPRYF